MTRLPLFFLLAGFTPLFAQPVALEAIKSYPFPTELTSSTRGSKIAWVFDEQGKRNIYAAEGPSFDPVKLTSYERDDGQELTSVALSADGQWVVYVRGGDHGSNWGDLDPVNPNFDSEPAKVGVWAVPYRGGKPYYIGEGDFPVPSPGQGGEVAYIHRGQVWIAKLDGSATGKSLFTTRGNVVSLQWAPDGGRLAFVTDRGDHRFIGIYTFSTSSIHWVAPAFSKDNMPRWSPDGKQLAFVRTPGEGGKPKALLERHHRPWAIWVADADTGEGHLLWEAPKTLRGSLPTTHGGVNLNWAAGNRIVFLSYQDGWPHLYSLSAAGGEVLQLTKGNFMCEYIRMSNDGLWMWFSANTGPDPLDIDRRHIGRVPVNSPAMEILTPGTGLEWAPVAIGDGTQMAYLSATPQRPPLPAVMDIRKKTSRLIAAVNIPSQFPSSQLIVPRQIKFQSADGLTVHGQWFEKEGGEKKKPAIIYVHGGPPRQMLLGWHYSDYYSNAYAINQYLAGLGFIVVTVNYRLGIGYGYEFHQPGHAGVAGASEYQDIKAAGDWLAKDPRIDAARIGIYGGSYGGYLTAMALGRDSKRFAAGVDIHGVHNRTINRTRNMILPDNYEKAPDAEEALNVAWQSSPVSSVDTWTSPVLIIHGDDDRNVRFSESTDLVQRLREKGVSLETFVVVDDTHHWMKWKNGVQVGVTTADFFSRQFLKPVKK